MSMSFQVLGDAGRDNALLVTIDSGQSVARLLFDCGEGCLNQAPFADTLAIDHLFFSHLHMDRVAGFDAFFRFHMTAKQAAAAAKRAAVGRLVLFHLSDRYGPEGWRAILAEAQAVFPATTFPDHWASTLTG